MKPELISDTAAAATAAAATNTNTTHRVAQTILSVEETSPEATATHAPQTGLPVLHCADTAPANILRFRRRGAFSRFLAKAAMLGAAVTAASVTPFDPDPADSPATARSLLGSFLAPTAQAADYSETGARPLNPGDYGTYENFTIATGGCLYYNGNVVQNLNAQYTWISGGGSDGNGALRIGDNNSAEVHINSKVVTIVARRAAVADDRTTFGGFENGATNGRGSTIWIHGVLRSAPTKNSYDTEMSFGQESGGSEANRRHIFILGSGEDFKGNVLFTNALNYFSFEIGDGTAAGNGSLAGGWDSATNNYALFSFGTNATNNLIFNRAAGSGTDVTALLDDNNNYLIHDNGTEDTTQKTYAKDNGDISLGYNINGAGSVIQRGTGSTTLVGTNTYTGATTVEAGKLILTGTNTGTSSVTVSPGATLVLDYANRDSHATAGTAILANKPLTLSGDGTDTPSLSILGGDSQGTLANAFSNLTLGADAVVSLVAGTGTTIALDLTALTLNGHTLAFEPDGDGTVTIKTNLPSSVYPDILFNGSPALVDSSGYLQAAADAPDVPVRGGVLSLANEIFTTHITDTGSGAATITIDDTGVTPAGGPLKVRALIMDSGTPGTINLSGKSLSLGTLELAAGTQLTLTDSTTAPTAPLGSQLALTTKVQLGENSTLTLARPTTVAAALAGTGTLALAASGEFTYNGNGTTFAGTVQIGAAGTTATTLTIPGAGFGTSATLAFGGTASVLQYTGAGSRTLGNVTGSGTVKATTGTALTVAANVPTLNFAVDSASSIRLGATVQIGDLTLAGGTYIPTSISTGGTGIALAGDVNLSGDVKFDIVALRDAGLLTIGGTYYFLDYTNLTAAPGTAYLFPGLPINSILFRDDGDKLGFYVQSLSFYRRTWTFGGDGGWSTGSFSNWSNVELPASATGDYFIFNGTGRTLTIGDDEVVRLLNGVTYTVSQLGDYDDMPTNADYGGLYKIDSNKWRITGGTIDTGTAETDKWAVMVRVTDGGLILDSKIIGSGNIAVKHRGNEQVGLIITGDASEYSGTIYCAPNRRGAALSGFGILGENADIVLDGKSWGASFFTINATTTFGAAVSMINTTTNSRLHIGVGNLHGYNDTNGTNFADWNTFAGVVTFTGNNNITVPVLVNRGILAVSKTENLGTSTVTLGNTGGIPGLQFIADGSTITKNVLIENASSIVKVGTADPLNDALDAITATYAGVFSGGGAITKTGKGTLILSNTNTYTGVTNVNAGILKVTGRLNNGTYSNTITIAAGAALEMANADAQTFSGGIAGAGKLIKSGGAGAVTLTTVKTYTGGTLISGGEIIGQLAFNGTNGVFGSFAAGNDILIQNGGILTINAADVFGNSGIATVTNQIITVEDGGLLRTGNTGGHFLGNIVLKGGNIELGAHDATWSFALMRTLAVTGGTAETPVESEIKMREGAAARLLKFGVASVPITVDAYSTLRVLVGTANGNNVATSAFVKKGGGILELTQAGTQTGVTIVEAGAIRFTDASVLGAATSVTLGDAASSTASGYLMFGAAGMNLSGKTLSLVTLAGGTGGGGIDTNGFDGTVSSVISGLGGFYKSGGGTLTLTNTSNSFSGAVNVIGVANVNEGVTTYNGVLASSDLSASGSNSALGAVSASIARDARKLKLENGGTFRFLGTQGSLSGADAPAAVRLPLAVTTGTTGFLDVPTADEVLAVGYINGSNIIKTGLGALYIGGGSGADDGVETGIAGGKLTVADGAVVLASKFNGLALEVQSGATLYLAADDCILTVAPLEIKAGGVLDIRGFNTTLGNLNGEGTVVNTYNNTGTIGAAWGRASGSGLEFSVTGGTFTGKIAAGISLIKTGTGVLTLSGDVASEHDLGTYVKNGTLVFKNDGNLGVANVFVVLGDYPNATRGILKLHADSVETAFTRPLLLSGAGGGIDTNGHNYTVNAAVGEDSDTVGDASAASRFVKTGLGTLTFAQPNTFRGGVSVEAGVLEIADNNRLGVAYDATTAPAATLTLGWDDASVADADTRGTLKLTAALGAAFTRPVVLAGSLGGILDIGTFATEVSSEISGAGAFTKIGSADLTLSGTNIYTGDTILSVGKLIVTGTLGAETGASTGIFDYTGGLVLPNAGYNILFSHTGDVQSISGGVTGIGGITKSNTGTLKISGALDSDTATAGNDYTGAIAVSTSGAWVEIANAGAQTLSGGVSGAGGFKKSGVGDLTLTAGTYAGDTGVTGGKLTVTGAFGTETPASSGNYNYTGAIEFTASAGVFAVNKTSAQTLSGVISGAGAIAKQNSGVLTLTGANTFTAGVTVSGGELIVSGLGTLGSDTAGNDISVAAATLTLDRAGVWDANSATVPAQKITLTGATLRGEGYANALGELTLNDASLLTTAIGATAHTDGTSDYVSTWGAFRLNGKVNVSGAGKTSYIKNSTDRASASVALTDATGGTEFAVASDAALEISTILRDPTTGGTAAAGSFTKTGAGTLILTNDNTYTGGAVVNAGTVVVHGDTALGATWDATTNTLATLTLGDGTANTQGTLQLAPAAAPTSPLTFARPLALAGMSGGKIDTNGYDAVFSEAVTGTVFQKAGAGTLTFSGAVALTGGTSVTGGLLALTGSLDSNAYAGNIALTGGSLSLGLTTDSALSGNISGTGSLTYNGGAELTLSGTNTFSGGLLVRDGLVRLTAANTDGLAYHSSTAPSSTITLGFDDTSAANTDTAGGLAFDYTPTSFTKPIALTGVGGYIAVAPGNSVTLGGEITGSAPFTKTETGTLKIASAAALFTGGLTVANGVLLLESDANLGAPYDATTAPNATLTLGWDDTSISDADTAGTLRFESNAATAALGIKRPIALVGTAGGIVDTNGYNALISSDISGSVSSFEKIGAGTLTLTGANTYTGATLVSVGKLVLGDPTLDAPAAVPASLANTTLLVRSGATFVSGGLLSGAATVESGGVFESSLVSRVTPGSGLTIEGGGLLRSNGGTLGNLTLASAAIVEVKTSLVPAYVGTLSIPFISGTPSDAAQIDISAIRYLLVNGSTPIIHYDNLSGDPSFLEITGASTGGRISISASNDIAAKNIQIDVVITNATLTWTGKDADAANATNTIWDPVLRNWYDAVAVDADMFYAGDTLLFDTTADNDAAHRTIQLSGPLMPAIVEVNTADTETGYVFVSHEDGGGDTNGRLIGAGKIIKLGTGTLTIKTNNEHSGGTELREGTLAVASAGAFGRGALAGGVSVLTVGQSGTDTPVVVHLLPIEDSGTAAADTYGHTTLNVSLGKSLALAAYIADTSRTGAAPLPLATFDVAVGRTLGFLGKVSDGRTTAGDGFVGGGGFIKTGAGTLAFRNIENDFAGEAHIQEGDWSVNTATALGYVTKIFLGTASTKGGLTAAGTLSVNTPVTLVGLGGVFSVGAVNTLKISSQISGAGFEKTGAGVLALANVNNDYTGITTVKAGALSFADARHLGASTGLVLDASTATAGLPDASVRVDSAAPAAISLSAALPVTVQGTGGNFDIATSKTLTFAGALDGAGKLVKTGAGTLSFTGTFGTTGAVEIREGTLETSDTDSSDVIALGDSALTLALGSDSAKGTLKLANGAPNVANANAVLGVAGVVVGNLGGAIETVTYPVELDTPLTGSGIFEKTGTVGKLTLSGDNTGFGGRLQVTGGTLAIASVAAAGNGEIRVFASSATLEFAPGTDTAPYRFANQITGTVGTVKIASGSTVTLGTASGTAAGTTFAGTYVVAGNLVLDAATDLGTGNWNIQLGDGASSGILSTAALRATSGTINFSSTHTLSIVNNSGTIEVALDRPFTIAGAIDATGQELVKTGAGILTLSSPSAGTQAKTTIADGTLSVLRDDLLGVTSGELVFDGGTLRTSATNFVIPNTRELFLDAPTATFEIEGPAAHLRVESILRELYDITSAAPQPYGYSLVKKGSGTLEIAVAQTDPNAGAYDFAYSGPTVVQSGVLALAVADALPNSASLDITGGRVAAAASQSFKALNVGAAGEFAFNNDASSRDLSVGDGNIEGTLTGVVNLNVSGTFSVADSKTVTVANKAFFGVGSTLVVVSERALVSAYQIEFEAPTVPGDVAPIIEVHNYADAPFVIARANAPFLGEWSAFDVNGNKPAPERPDPKASTALGVNSILADDGKYDLLLATGLVWNNAAVTTVEEESGTMSAYNRSVGTAHGFFYVEDAADTLTISNVLNDNSAVINSTNGHLGYAEAPHSTTDTDYGDYAWDGKSLTKTGAGTLVLSGSNSYSGTTTVEDGVVSAKNVRALGTNVSQGVALVLDSSVLRFDVASGSSYAGEFAKEISGLGSLQKAGAGTVWLTAENTFEGETRIVAGVLELRGSGKIETSSGVVLAPLGTLGDGQAHAFRISAAGAPVTINALSGDALGSVDLGSTALTIGVADVADGTVGDGAGIYAGAFTGSANVTKQGLGRLTLSGQSVFTGGITLAQGELELASAKGAGAGAITHTADDGTLVLANGVTAANNITLTVGAPREIAVEAISASAALSGRINGAAGSVFAKTGDGRLTLSTAAALQNYAGEVQVEAGTLEVVSQSFTQKLGGTGRFLVTLASSAQVFAFGANSANAFSGEFALPKGTLPLGGASGANGVANAATLAGADVVLGADATAVIASDVALASLAPQGAALRFDLKPHTATGILSLGELRLGGGASPAATVRLGTDVSADTAVGDLGGVSWFGLWQGAATATQQIISAPVVTGPSAPGTIAVADASGAAIPLTGRERVITEGTAGETGVAKFFWRARVETSKTDADVAQNGVWLDTSLLEISAHSAKSVTLAVPAGATAATARLSARLTGGGGFLFSGAAGSDISVGGAEALTGARSDYTGATRIVNVAVALVADSALGETRSLALEGVASLDIGAWSQRIGSLDGGQNTAVTIGEDGGRLGGLTVDGGGSFAGSISGAGTLAKAGAGAVLTLAGPVSHTGGTIISAGELRVSGDLGTAGADGVPSFAGSFNIGGEGTFTVAKDSAQTLTGEISGGGALVKTGSGLLTLAPDGGENSHGPTTVSGGALRITSDDALGTARNTLDGATLIFAAGAGGSSTEFAKSWTLAGTATLEAEGDALLSGSLTGGGSLVKTGPGELLLGAANNFTGGVTVRGGTLAFGGDANLGAGTNLLDGGTLAPSANVTAHTKSWTVSANGGAIAARLPDSGDAVSVVFGGDLSGSGTLAVRGILPVLLGADGKPLADPNAILELNGVVSAKLIVESGIIGGSGRLADVSFAPGATLSPGTAGGLGALRVSTAGGLTEFEGVTFRVDLGAAGGADWVSVANDAAFSLASPNTVDIAYTRDAVWPEGSFVLLTASGNLLADDALLAATRFLFKGVEPVGERVKAELVRGGEGGKSILLNTHASASGQLVWNGDATTANWEKGPGTTGNWLAGEEASFQDGDTVLFPVGKAPANGVLVTNLGGGVVVGGLIVEGTGYKFSGGKIVGASLRTTGADSSAADGRLVVAQNGGAVFENDLDFAGISVEAGASAEFAGRTRSEEPLQIASGADVTLSGRSVLDTPSVVNAGKLVVDRVAGVDFAYAGVVSGAGAVEKTGGGTLTLTGTNTYTGGTTVRGGALVLASDGNVGSGVNTLDGGALRLDGAAFGKDWVVAAGGGAIEVAAGGEAVFSGKLTDAQGTAAGAEGAFAKRGAGTLVLAGDNTFAGALSVEAGTLEVRGALGTVADSGAATRAGGVVIGSVATVGTDAASQAKLVFAGSATQALTGALSGAGTLEKTGDAKLELTADTVHTVAAWDNKSGEVAVAGDINAARGVVNAGVFSARDVRAVAEGLTNTGTFAAESFSGASLKNTGGTVAVAGAVSLTTGALENSGEFSAASLVVPAGAINNGNAVVAGDAVLGSSLTRSGKFENRASAAFVAENISAVAGVENSGALTARSALTVSLGLVNNAGGTVAAPSLQVESGDLVNAGHVSAGNAAVPADSELKNTGVFEVGGGAGVFTGTVNNSVRGTFTAGLLNGNLVNNGQGNTAVSADIGRITGTVANSGLLRIGGDAPTGEKAFATDVVNNLGGVIDLKKESASHTISGLLKNDGIINFMNFGQTLTVRDGIQNATQDGVGSYNIELDLANPANSDHVVLEGAARIEGRHIFIVRTVRGMETASKDTRVPLIVGAAGDVIAGGDAHIVLDRPVEAGLYSFDILPGTATVAAQGVSALGQAAVNSAGVLGTGWFAQLDNIGKRLGDTRTIAEDKKAVARTRLGEEPPPVVPLGENDFWVRGYGSQLNADFGLSGIAGARAHQYGADLGYDRVWRGIAGGELLTGAFAGYQSTRLTFRGGQGGEGDTESEAAGAYASWRHDAGWYVAAVAKGQYFSTEYKARTTNGRVTGDFDSYGLGFSIEAGKRFELGAGWFAEPSIQVGYTHLFAGSYSLATVGKVNVQDSDIIQYIESVKLGKSWDTESFGRVTAWVRGAVERQDSDGGKVGFTGGDHYTPTLDGLRGVGGIGVVWSFTRDQQIHAEYEASFGEKYDKPWSINVGYRVRF